jgi:protein-arginine kinase activator protein McsA
MSVVDKLKSVVTTDDSLDETRFECTECGAEFGSYKSPERVSCEECLSREVEPVDA